MRDFKFKSYCPDVFRGIRAIFHLRPDDYLINICGNFQYLEFISNSKSGSFFFYSHDRRFMIKTITKSESKFLRNILPQYYQYIKTHPNTLLTRFYGMHRVKPHKKKLRRFLIMQSIFYTSVPSIYIHQTFDLKGSTLGRNASEKEKLTGNPVYKDNDFEEFHTQIKISGERKNKLIQQLTSDCKFLCELDIMDYSLLLGIHYRSREQTDEALDAITEDELNNNIQYSCTVDQNNNENELSITQQYHQRQYSAQQQAQRIPQPQLTPQHSNTNTSAHRSSMPNLEHHSLMNHTSTIAQAESEDRNIGVNDIDSESTSNNTHHMLQQLQLSTNSPSTKQQLPSVVTPSHSNDQGHVLLNSYPSHHNDSHILHTPRGNNTLPRTPNTRTQQHSSQSQSAAAAQPPTQSYDIVNNPLHSPQHRDRQYQYGLPKRYDQIKKAADINFHPPAFEPLSIDNNINNEQYNMIMNQSHNNKRRQSSVDIQSPNTQYMTVQSPTHHSTAQPPHDIPQSHNATTPLQIHTSMNTSTNTNTNCISTTDEPGDSVIIESCSNGVCQEMAVPTVEEIVRQIHAAEQLNLHNHSNNNTTNDTTTSTDHASSDQSLAASHQPSHNLFRLHSDSLYDNSSTNDELSICSDDNNEVYYLGIIDILTQYNLKKKFEHTFKQLTHKSNEISCAPPDQYADRFVKFITKHIG